MKVGKQRGALAQGVAIQLALAMMSDGRAKSKSEAAQLAGIDQSALKPQALARYAASNPIGRLISQSAPNLLQITAEVNGKRMCLAESLSIGVETSIRILGTLGPKLNRLTKAQDAQFVRAKRWLDLCRSTGLFGPPQTVAIPSELANQPAPLPPAEGNVADFLGEGDSSGAESPDSEEGGNPPAQTEGVA